MKKTFIIAASLIALATTAWTQSEFPHGIDVTGAIKLDGVDIDNTYATQTELEAGKTGYRIWRDVDTNYYAAATDGSITKTNTSFSTILQECIDDMGDSRIISLKGGRDMNGNLTGRYFMDGAVTNTVTGLRLTGDGNQQTRIEIADGYTNDLFVIGTAADAQGGIFHLDNMLVRGSATNSNPFFDLRRCAEFVCEDVEFNSMDGAAIRYDIANINSHYNYISDCWFVLGEGDFIQIYSSDGTRNGQTELMIENCIFALQDQTGISVATNTPWQNLSVSGNIFKDFYPHTSHAIEINDGSNYLISDNMFRDFNNQTPIAFGDRGASEDAAAIITDNLYHSDENDTGYFVDIGANVSGVRLYGNEAGGATNNAVNGTSASLNVGNNEIKSAAYSNATDFAQVSNNLSDLGNAGTARANLGVAINSDVLGYYQSLFDLGDKGILPTINFTGTPFVNASTMWHAGNDGSGSGLNADLLDGNDSTDFVSRIATTDITPEYPRTENPAVSTNNNVGVGYFGGLSESTSTTRVEYLEWQTHDTTDQYKTALLKVRVPTTIASVSNLYVDLKANQAADDMEFGFVANGSAVTATNTLLAVDSAETFTNDISGLGLTAGQTLWIEAMPDGLSTTNSADTRYIGAAKWQLSE